MPMVLIALCAKDTCVTFVLTFLTFEMNDFDSLWSNLSFTVTISNPLDGRHIQGSLMNLDRHNKTWGFSLSLLVCNWNGKRTCPTCVGLQTISAPASLRFASALVSYD